MLSCTYCSKTYKANKAGESTALQKHILKVHSELINDDKNIKPSYMDKAPEVAILKYDDIEDVKFTDTDEQLKRTWVGSKKLTIRERFDKDKLNWLILNKAKYLKPGEDDKFIMAKAYLNRSCDGVIETHYKKTGYDGMGRLFASYGLQNMWKPLRNTICADIYDDIDISNAHPTFLEQLCLKANIKCELLSKYIQDRNYDKKDVLKLINGGNVQIDENFDDEIHNIRRKLAVAHKEFYDEVAKWRTKANSDRTALSLLMCDMENKALMHACEYLDRCGKADTLVLCFDGIMVEKGVDIDGLTKYVSGAMGFPIKWVKKPMNNMLEIDGHPTKYIDRNGISPHDPYVWLDFDQDYRAKRYADMEELIDNVIYDLRRVLARVEQAGSGFYIKKDDCDDHLYTIIKADKFRPDLYFYIGKKKTPLRQILDILVMRMRRFATMGFAPGENDPRLFNMFHGYQGQLLEKYDVRRFKKMYKHIFEVICNEQASIFHYLMRWLAQILKHPGKRTGVVPFICGPQGAGKNMLTNFVAKYVIGRPYSRDVVGIKPLLEKHNTILENSKFLVLNETRELGGWFMANFDKFKSIITESHMYIDPKGRDGYNARNYNEIVLLSNHENCILIEEDDRRYLCIEVSGKHAQDIPYFDDLLLEFNGLAGDHFYTFLMTEYGDLGPLGTPPMTPLKQRMMDISRPQPRRFLSEVSWDIPPTTYEELYQLYLDWARNCGESSMSLKKFSMAVRPIMSRYIVSSEKKRVKFDLTNFAYPDH